VKGGNPVVKNIEIRNGRVMYYGNEAGYVDNGKAVVDPIFRGDALSAFLKKEKLEALWTNGVYDRLAAAGEAVAETPQASVTGQAHGSSASPILKSCRVWQLKPDVDICMKFIGYDELLKNYGEPDPANYRLAYDGQVETNDLEALYAKFNTEQPPGYDGHSLSMSDVVELYDETGGAFHYVDRFGFREIGFDPSGQQLGQRPALSP
jgi:hypothetical protein